MKNFVKLIHQLYEENLTKVFTGCIAKRKPVVFLSIAPIASAVEQAKAFRAQGLNITNLIVVDSTPPPVNLEFNVVNVSAAAQIYPQPEYVFVTTSTNFKMAKKFMRTAKIIMPSLIFDKNTDQVFEFFMEHLPELQEVYESLIDEESRRTFRGYWLGCITNQMSEVIYANAPQYICRGFLPKAGDVVIDCGCYDGSTALRFLDIGCKVYGFEMDTPNFLLAAKCAEKNNFVVENFGLGSHNHVAKFSSIKGGSTHLDAEGTESAQIITLDSYVREKNLPHVDFIKMDVEGAELDILRGATMTIARFKPILALSAYHKLDDLWTLTNFLKSICPDYEFALRQYATTPQDMPDWFSTKSIEFFDNFGLKINLPTYGECVLFAR